MTLLDQQQFWIIRRYPDIVFTSGISVPVIARLMVSGVRYVAREAFAALPICTRPATNVNTASMNLVLHHKCMKPGFFDWVGDIGTDIILSDKLRNAFLTPEQTVRMDRSLQLKFETFNQLQQLAETRRLVL